MKTKPKKKTVKRMRYSIADDRHSVIVTFPEDATNEQIAWIFRDAMDLLEKNNLTVYLPKKYQ